MRSASCSLEAAAAFLDDRARLRAVEEATGVSSPMRCNVFYTSRTCKTAEKWETPNVSQNSADCAAPGGPGRTRTCNQTVMSGRL